MTGMYIFAPKRGIIFGVLVGNEDIRNALILELYTEGHDRSEGSRGDYCASHQLGRLAWSDAPIFKASGLGVLRRNQQSHTSN